MAIQTEQMTKSSLIRHICPYCNEGFKIHLEVDLSTKKSGVISSVIKPHSNCGYFLIFVDRNGAIRGTQCIDGGIPGGEKDLKEKDYDFAQNMKLFEAEEVTADFHYVVGIMDNKLSSKGIITAKKVKYHRLIRSILFQEWLKQIFKSEQGFGFIFMEELFIITINLNNKILFTLGIEQENFDLNLNLNDLPSMVQYIKKNAISLGIL